MSEHSQAPKPQKFVQIKNSVIHVGTSGWHYKHWLGDFYPKRFPPAKMLEWYAREFHTVEINNSFYRLPEEKTFERWRKAVPAGFLFAVKASRFLTHIKRLKDPEDSIKLFFSRAKHLGPHLGPTLFQLPPKWKADAGRLAAFCELLPPKHRYVIEFRDDSWYTAQIHQLLQRNNIALCLHDWRSADWARELTADFAYIRFHGTNGKYAGNYPEHMLQHWAEQIHSWGERLSQVFAYFNNDIGGHAIRNAKSLRAMLALPPGTAVARDTNNVVRHPQIADAA
ncbi:MAG TPA: DUF72 domain-containing protein [Terriglobales bacterium]|nr:DUF72 domain-containing protein [Terriglobales bacterium]